MPRRQPENLPHGPGPRAMVGGSEEISQLHQQLSAISLLKALCVSLGLGFHGSLGLYGLEVLGPDDRFYNVKVLSCSHEVSTEVWVWV